MLLKEAVLAFEEALSKTKVPHGELLALEDNGWREEFPDERFWRFTHLHFPGLELRWSPGHKPWVYEKEKPDALE